jgi:signal transduction histidine kinase
MMGGSALAGKAAAERLPSWLGSIRFRLTAIYSLLLFGLAAMVVGGMYAVVAHRLEDEPVSRTFIVQEPVVTPEGIALRDERVQEAFRTFEREVNDRALDKLRNAAFIGLGLLFLASLGVGWFVAGLVLAPINRITGVARQIQATDLSRRIGLGGPHDELRDLADTFDGMLDRLEVAFEGQRRFIQDASHELRNPLAVIRTNLDVALADPDADVDELRRTAVVVGRTAARMSQLVEDLVAYARHGLPDQQWEDVDLSVVACETVDEFQVPAGARHLTLLPHVAPEVHISGDRNALKQALANLVSNAVRLAPPSTTVTVAAGLHDGWAFLSVADEGPGIPEAQHELVFDRFWRAPGQPESVDGERPTGLGLAIVREIIESHGGRVALASTDGEGTTFVLWLPVTE